MKTKIIVLTLTAVISISSIFAINSYAAQRKEDIINASLPIVLKRHENSVAAYQGDRLLETFENIIYSSLPEFDRNALKSGIEFSNMTEVYSAVEDYDG